MWRRTGLALAIVCAFGGVGVTGASAADKPTPNPQELWRAFPLDETPTAGTTTGGTAPAPAAPKTQAPTTTAPSSLPQDANTEPSWIVLVAAAVGGAAFAWLLVALYTKWAAARRARVSERVEPVVPAPQREPLWRSAEHRSEPATPRPRPASARPVAPALPRPVPSTQANLLRPPIAATPRVSPAARQASRPTASRNGLVCQVRWSRRGAYFYAVTTSPDGVERRIARSPRFEWSELSPPDQESREAQAALRKLAKELREKGWRPLRAKGFDFDERRWYARRFRWPTETETNGAGPSTTPDRHVSARQGGANAR
jgi:hypothetical protein